MAAIRKSLFLVCSFLLLAGVVTAQNGPDVIVGELTGPGNYGMANGYHAYSVGTTSCNKGTANLSWIASTNQHPVIAQHLYRLRNGRFEQIGISWLKHGFTALQGNVCNLGCTPSGSGSWLGVGCSDPYGAGLNASQGNGPRSEVNASTGFFPYPYLLDPPVTDTTSRRIRVNSNDVDPALNAGAQYFIEGQYVAPDDAAAGNHHNNASYREVQVAPGSFALSFVGPTEREKPAIEAWADVDPSVTITQATVDGGRFYLGTKVTDLGSGFWRYEYALHNLSSDRSAGSFSIPVPAGVVTQNENFHDVEYHSGEPYSGADWPHVRNANDITWETEPYSMNQNANALRWGTLYNFRFVAASAPVSALATVGLFKPGTPATIAMQTMAPITSTGNTPAVTGLTCTTAQLDATLTWTNAATYDSVLIFRNGQQVATLAGGDTSYTDTSLPIGQHSYLVNGVANSVPSAGTGCVIDVVPALPITGLICTTNVYQAELTWTNNDPYDFIEVRRNGLPLTTLLGNDTQFTDVGLNVGTFEYELTPGFGPYTAPPIDCTVTIMAPPPINFEFEASSPTVPFGMSGIASFGALVSVSEDAGNVGFPNDVSGFSLALTHDSALLTATSVDVTAAVNAANGGAGPDFVAGFLHADGVTLGTVFAFDLSWSLQASSSTPIVLINYDTVASALAGTTMPVTTMLTFVDGVLGVPPVDNSVASGITNNIPSYVDGVVTLTPGGAGGFIRADADGDGSVNLTDAIAVLGYLFNSGPALCVAALDYNDDGSANLVDAIGILGYLFTSGPDPLPPFPNCGTDPTPDLLPPCSPVPACP